MLRVLVGGILVAALTGCAYQLNLQQRGGGAFGAGTASNGNVEIQVGQRTFRGQYVYASASSTTSFFGTANRRAFNTFGTTTSGGNGNIIARSQDGVGLRCQFNYSETSSQGLGECVDDAGATYDLQIRMGGGR